MGLIVDDHGRYRGWLASLLCCCVALTEDEYPAERQKEQNKQAAVPVKQQQYNQQPPLTSLPSLPDKARVSSNDKSESDANSLHDSQNSDPFNLTRPLNFDPDCLLPQSAAEEAKTFRTQLSRSTTDGSERTPRHLRPSPGGSLHRPGLVPLPLGPVVLRDPYDLTQTVSHPAGNRQDTDGKHRHQRSESTQDLLSHAARQSYHESRETPYQRCGRRSTETLAMRMPAHPQPLLSHSPMAASATASTPSLSSSFARPAKEANIPLAFNDRPRTGARLQRKRSNQSKASHGTSGDSDVEKEVLELNTIVEERRAESNKTRSRDSHVPAVAPSMQVRARSETLNDIGSALSRPLPPQQQVHEATSFIAEADSREIRRKSSKSSSHVSGWLSNVTTPMPTPTQSVRNGNAPYSRGGASHDRAASTSSSTTALDSVTSVSYTLESSSPTIPKRYSRSLMITPLAPLDDVVDAENGPAGRVGVAL